MPTYPVTGTLTDLGLVPRPNRVPMLRFTPPELSALATGELVITEPVEVTPAANGTFTANLATTDDLIYKGRGWTLAVHWLNPDGYKPGEGYNEVDHMRWLLSVPRGGGRLVDFINAKVAGDVVAIINSRDQALIDDLYSRGVRVVIDTSVTPVDFYRLEA